MDGLSEIQELVDAAVQEQLPTILNLKEPSRTKALTCLMYEYLLQDMEEKAFELMDLADPDYFKLHFMNDLKDPQFKQIFQTMVHKFIELGYIKVGKE